VTARARAGVWPAMARVNWYGLWSLYLKEVRRFTKIPAQTLIAP